MADAQITTVDVRAPEKLDKSDLNNIGNTPLLEIKRITKNLGKDVKIYAKAEWHNLGGSVKARPALRMINDGIKSGEFSRGKILLDATSGNTGIAYAMIGKIMGFPVRLVLPEHVCQAHKGLMAKSYGAELELSDPMEQSDGAIRLANEIYAKDPDKYFMPDQYNNPSNWKAHRDTTAKEIWEQTKGTVTHFVAGIGTSGTLMGTTRGLQAFNPEIKSYAVEPAELLHGLEGLKHMDSSIVPGIYDPSVFDEKISIKTEDAYAMVRELEKLEGFCAGQSSGAAMLGAMRLAEKIEKGVIVTVFPDHCPECSISHGEFTKRCKQHGS